MNTRMKKVLAAILAAVLLVGCAAGAIPVFAERTTPEETEALTTPESSDFENAAGPDETAGSPGESVPYAVPAGSPDTGHNKNTDAEMGDQDNSPVLPEDSASVNPTSSPSDISGSDHPGQEDIITEDGLGDAGDPGNPDHIYSYNCRHQHYPYWPGISEPIKYEPEPGPFTIDGKTYTYYQATQRQRKMERDIRALKREVNAGGDKALLGSRIRQKTQEYNAFSNACDLRPKLERLRVLGYDRGTAAKVQKAVKVEDIRALIKSDAITKKVNAQKQNRHIFGSQGYVKGRSFLYGDLATAQALVDQYHGTGTPTFSKRQKWTNKEVVETDNDVGCIIDPDSGAVNATNRFTIHYSLTGTHIVPAKRRQA